MAVMHLPALIAWVSAAACLVYLVLSLTVTAVCVVLPPASVFGSADEAIQNRSLIEGPVRGLSRCGRLRLDALFDPAPPLGIGDVHELDADCAAI